MKISIWLVGLAMIGSAGCAHQRNTASTSDHRAADFYPLAVGNRWTYDTKFLGETREMKVEIVGANQRGYVDNQGNELVYDGFGIRDAKRYLLRDPIAMGKEWTNVVSISSIERYRVVDTDIDCETPAGRFSNCVRVEGRNRMNDDTTLVSRWTFAKGVGIAQVETFAESKGKQIPQTRLQLKSYHVASKSNVPLKLDESQAP